MGWIEAQQRYKSGETLAEQNVEDLVARRVLRGLGFVARQIGDLEKALGLPSNWDQALWPRTIEVLRVISARTHGPWLFGTDLGHPGLFAIDVREVDPGHKRILELGDMLAVHRDKPHPLFLTRVKGTQVSLAYYPLTADPDEGYSRSATWLKPPVRFIAEFGPWWIAVQETEHFIAQFGPYQSPFVPEE